MSYRLQSFPQSGPHDAPPLNDWRSALPANLDDAGFSRSWLVYDFKVRPGLELPNINWNAMLGIALATVVSGGVWAGVGLTIARFWN